MWEVLKKVRSRAGSEAGAGWQVRTLKGHSHEVLSVAISVDGKCVVSGSEDDTVKIWDVETGAEVRRGCSGERVRLGGGVGCVKFRGNFGFRSI